MTPLRHELRPAVGILAWATFSLLVISAAACSGNPPGPAGAGAALLTSSSFLHDHPARGARGEGVVNVGNDGFVHVGPQLVVWPRGYTVRRTRAVEVCDESGQVVAREGETITFGGGLNYVPVDSGLSPGIQAFWIQTPVTVE